MSSNYDDFPVQRRKMELLRERAILGIGHGRDRQFDDAVHRKRRVAYKNKRLEEGLSYKASKLKKRSGSKVSGSKKPRSGSKVPVRRVSSSKKPRSGSKVPARRVSGSKKPKSGSKVSVRRVSGSKKPKPKKLSEYNLFVRAFLNDFKRNNPNSKLEQSKRFIKAAKSWKRYKEQTGKPPITFVKTGKRAGKYSSRGETGERTIARRAMGFGYQEDPWDSEIDY